jgi:hypothetical protein
MTLLTRCTWPSPLTAALAWPWRFVIYCRPFFLGRQLLALRWSHAAKQLGHLRGYLALIGRRFRDGGWIRHRSFCSLARLARAGAVVCGSIPLCIERLELVGELGNRSRQLTKQGVSLVCRREILRGGNQSSELASGH